MKVFRRYWETVRHLKPIQIYGRLWNRLYRPIIRPIDCLVSDRVSEGWVVPVTRVNSMKGPRDFVFLNHRDSLPEARGWADIGNSQLWRYNLHYFDDLCSCNFRERQKWHEALIHRWIGENKIGRELGWDSYPTSLRIVNWVKWVIAGNDLSRDWARNLMSQARWLCRRVEWHLLGNHLLANAKALVFAGCFFQGKESEKLLRKGLRILADEIHEQIFPDGGHFELSPMYHSIILEDFLDLVNLSKVYPHLIHSRVVKSWEKTVVRMIHWINAMTHPDGEISFFNDSAMKYAGGSAELRQYADRLGIQSISTRVSKQTHLADSGYLRWEKGKAIVIADIGRVGPDYLPGHAHADSLSFELSIGTQRVLVNSGTSLYASNAERLRQRGTRAHNTVEIDEENSSEVWDSFRVARRAYPIDCVIEKNNENWVSVECSHDGYKRLIGKNIHIRRWELQDQQLAVIDEIMGPYQTAVGRFYLHPNVSVQGNCLYLPDGSAIRFIAQGGRIDVVESTWHPEFGVSIATHYLEVFFERSEVHITFKWD